MGLEIERFVFVNDKANNEVSLVVYNLRPDTVLKITRALIKKPKVSFNVYTDVEQTKTTFKIRGIDEDSLTDILAGTIVDTYNLEGVEKTKPEVNYAAEVDTAKLKDIFGFSAECPWAASSKLAFARMPVTERFKMLVYILDGVIKSEDKALKQNYIFSLANVTHGKRVIHMISTKLIETMVKTKGVDLSAPDYLKTALKLCGDEDLSYVLNKTREAWVAQMMKKR